MKTPPPAMMKQRVTRLAPSPTGALHLGNARTFLVNYLLARTRGWRIVLRMEDLDGPRVKPGAASETLTDLEWLGLEWDLRTPDQSQRDNIYRTALRHLASTGRVYPCTCSRKDVELAASAPHQGEHTITYPGTCRDRWANPDQAKLETGRPPAYRLSVQDAVIEFEDAFAGPQRFSLATTSGDFVIFKFDGTASYQLAVVVDDAAAGVTDVVRADDLLDSTPRQILLQQLLGLGAPPRYWHLPLILGPDGRRLAKRHGDTRLFHYRTAETSAHRLLGLLGYWSGIIDTRRPTEMAELLERFGIEQVPTEPIVMSEKDTAYLAGART